MPYEIKEVLQLQLGTVRKPKYEVYDLFGSQDFEVSSATFSLKNAKSGTEISSGSCAVDNNDEDAAGNAIKTVRPTINLGSTDAEKGKYSLSLHVHFSNGEDDVFKVPVDLVDFEEA